MRADRCGDAQGAAQTRVLSELVDGRGQSAGIARLVGQCPGTERLSQAGQVAVDDREAMGLGLDGDQANLPSANVFTCSAIGAFGTATAALAATISISATG